MMDSLSSHPIHHLFLLSQQTSYQPIRKQSQAKGEGMMFFFMKITLKSAE